MDIRLRNNRPAMYRRSLSFFSLQRIGRGFTLVELLVAMLIMGFVAAAAVTVFSVFIFHFEQTNELTTAQQNGEMVLTILRNPVLHAGLALPASADDLPDVFSPDLKDNMISLFVDGPVTVIDLVGDGGDPPGGNVLLVLYGVPSRLMTTDSGDLGLSAIEIKLNGPVNGNLDDAPSNLTKAWGLFPTAGVPARVTAIATSGGEDTLTLVSAEGDAGSIATYDELYYLRGMRAYARKGYFCTEDLTLQEAQRRVENIAALLFESPTANLLKISVVAAGAKKYDEEIYSGWSDFQAKFPGYGGSEFEDFAEEWKYHRMRVLSESWRVRN